MRKTKIVATLGPASETKEVVMEMAKAGMNVARINMSHGTFEDHKRRIDMVKAVREELGEPIAIMIDTKGPEIRLKSFENDFAMVEDDQEFVIVNQDVIGNSNEASVTCPDFYLRIKIGDIILMCDGLIKMTVENIVEKNIHLRVNVGGKLSNSKSINVPGVSLNLPYLSEADKKDILFGIENDIDFVAASFVSTREDMLSLRKFLCDNNGSNIDIVAKIESVKGVENLEQILPTTDGIMVARGDLGVEIPYAKLPSIQKDIIKKSREAGKRVITATEMLESMISNPRPTRAETSDVANAVYDGTSAIMLSAESAIGKYPVLAIKTMANIAGQTESDINYKHRFHAQEFKIETIADSISNTAVKASLDLDCALIWVVTDTGTSARLISRFRPICPIVAITTNHKTYFQLGLSWGVVPLFAKEQQTIDYLFTHSTDIQKLCNFVASGDKIISVASTTMNKSGFTNILKIENVK